jgi:hypothetical protein
MTRNAWLFGRLTGLRIIHEAPIPLFHNQVSFSGEMTKLYQWSEEGWTDGSNLPLSQPE